MGSGSKPTSSVSDPMCSTHRALAYSYDAGQERLRTGPTSTGSDTSSCATKGLFGRSCAAELETEPTSSGSYLVVLPAVLWDAKILVSDEVMTISAYAVGDVIMLSDWRYVHRK